MKKKRKRERTRRKLLLLKQEQLRRLGQKNRHKQKRVPPQVYKSETNMHHRKPKSLGGGDEIRNISRVSIVKHDAFNKLFKNGTPQEIANILNDTWLDPAWVLIAKRKED